MQRDEQRLREKVLGLLAAAEKVDAAEDAEHGVGRRGDELPEELQRTEGRLKKIREAKAALETEAKQCKEEEQAAKDNDDDPPPGPRETPLPKHKVPTTRAGTPTDKAQRNFTDPDSRIMKTGDGYVQGYNCQIMVDAAHQIVVAEAVTNQPPDPEHLVPMLVKNRRQQLRRDATEAHRGRWVLLREQRVRIAKVGRRSLHRHGPTTSR